MQILDNINQTVRSDLQVSIKKEAGCPSAPPVFHLRLSRVEEAAGQRG